MKAIRNLNMQVFLCHSLPVILVRKTVCYATWYCITVLLLVFVILFSFIIMIINTLVLLFTALCYSSSYQPIAANDSEVWHIHSLLLHCKIRWRRQFVFSFTDEMCTNMSIKKKYGQFGFHLLLPWATSHNCNTLQPSCYGMLHWIYLTVHRGSLTHHYRLRVGGAAVGWKHTAIHLLWAYGVLTAPCTSPLGLAGPSRLGTGQRSS